METTHSSETSVDLQRTTRRHIPEDRTVHNHRCENLKSDIEFVLFQVSTGASDTASWTSSMIF
jgi:hypothetical protein